MDKLHKKLEEMFEAYHAPAHDFKHVLRTASLAKQIARCEGYDEKEAEIAGLLHDVGRTVKDPVEPHAKLGVPIARELLDTYTDFDEEAKLRILKSIEVHSDLTTEGELNHIVQDADKLDGIGAIGINRAYISSSGRIPDYLPDDLFPSDPQYGKFKSAHELIIQEVKWYDMLYTTTAKRIGKPRYEFMKAYMEQFRREVEETK